MHLNCKSKLLYFRSNFGAVYAAIHFVAIVSATQQIQAFVRAGAFCAANPHVLHFGTVYAADPHAWCFWAALVVAGVLGSK